MLFKKHLKHFLLVMSLFLFVLMTQAQSYRNISGWTMDTNHKIESFLNTTLIRKDRKVAVFDCDGTLLGQSPYYLADEAIYAFAKDAYGDKKDSLSQAKMKIIENLRGGNNVGVDYVQNRIEFLSGLAPEEIEAIGDTYFYKKYATKFYPEMRELLANLEAYGFEIWILTASPEILYQQFVHANLGIPKNRILGVKSVISQGKVTDQLVYPIPQDKGKAEAIATFIKAKPLFVGGNSRGDLEMMNTSIGIKMIVNPDDEKVEHGTHAGAMDGFTVKQYWNTHNGLSVYCNDVPEGNYTFVSEEMNIKSNKEHPKTK